MADIKKRQVLGIMKGIYSRIRYLGRKEKSRECKRSNRRIWEGIPMKHERCKVIRERKETFRKKKLLERFIAKKLFR